MSEYFNTTKESVERARRSDVLSRFLRSAEDIEPLHGKTVPEVFSNEDEKRTFIENLKPDELFDVLNGVNGILREKNTLHGVLLGTGYVPPRHEDKPKLLSEVLSAAQEMSRNKRNLKDIALLFSSALNAIHPYADANGRTSRLIFLLLSEDFNNKTQSELSEVLGLYGREKIDVNPGRAIYAAIEGCIEKDIGLQNPKINTDNITNLFGYKKDIEFSKEITDESQNLFTEIFEQDTHNLFLGVFQYLQTQKDKEQYIRRFPQRSAVPIKLLSKNITQEGLNQILQSYWNLKNKHIELLIDIIAHPEKEEYQIECEGKKISLKDYFELEINGAE